MAENINISKKVYPRLSFERVVDRNFKFFVPDEQIIETETIDDLFRLYERFYLEVPLQGSRQSHTYLRDRSAELVGFPLESTDIQDLLREITSLRDNFAAQIAENNSLRLQIAELNATQ